MKYKNSIKPLFVLTLLSLFWMSQPVYANDDTSNINQEETKHIELTEIDETELTTFLSEEVISSKQTFNLSTPFTSFDEEKEEDTKEKKLKDFIDLSEVEQGNAIEAEKDGFLIEEKNGLWGITTTSGKEVLPFEYTVLEYHTPDFIIASKKADENGKSMTGAVNLKGETIIPYEYSSLHVTGKNFCMGIIEEKDRDLVGAFNLQGELIIPFEFAFIEYHTENAISVICLPTEDEPDHYGHSAIYNHKGKEIIKEGKYTNLHFISEKCIIASQAIENKKDEKNKDKKTYTDYYGAIDLDGKEIIPFIYDSINPVPLYNSNKYHKEILEYSKNNGTKGMMDTKGKEFFKRSYIDLTYITDNCIIASVRDYDKPNETLTGIITKDEKIVTALQYADIEPMTKNYFTITNHEDKMGLISAKGKVIIPCQYDLVRYLRLDCIIVANEKKNPMGEKNIEFGIVDMNHTFIIPMGELEIKH